MFNCFNKISDYDRQTDTHTETDSQEYDGGIYRASIASRGKNLHK